MNDLQNAKFPTFDVIQMSLDDNLPNFDKSDPVHFAAIEHVLAKMADRAKERGNYVRRYKLEYVHEHSGKKYISGVCMEYPYDETMDAPLTAT